MDKRYKIITLLEQIFNTKAKTKVRFEWCTNQITLLNSIYFDGIFEKISKELNWNYSKASIEYLPVDAYFDKPYNFLFVFDEYYKFSSYRLKTLELYPPELDLNFDMEEYMLLCRKEAKSADQYQKGKERTDFNFNGGALAKRALLDAMMDIKPIFNGLNPTFRLNEFELPDITGDFDINVLEKIINNKLL